MKFKLVGKRILGRGKQFPEAGNTMQSLNIEPNLDFISMALLILHFIDLCQNYELYLTNAQNGDGVSLGNCISVMNQYKSSKLHPKIRSLKLCCMPEKIEVVVNL